MSSKEPVIRFSPSQNPSELVLELSREDAHMLELSREDAHMLELSREDAHMLELKLNLTAEGHDKDYRAIGDKLYAFHTGTIAPIPHEVSTEQFTYLSEIVKTPYEDVRRRAHE